jgi:hypothetical protein
MEKKITGEQEMVKYIFISLFSGIIFLTMSFTLSLAQTCNYNGICESGEDINNCVYDCLISTLHKNIKIQNASYNIMKVIHYKLDGSKQTISNLETIKDFFIDKVDFSVLGIIGENGQYRLYELTDNIPVINYRNAAICNQAYLQAEEWQAYNQHEDWFVHQRGETISAENRVFRKWFPDFLYLYNPVPEWIQEFANWTKLHLDNEPGFKGVFLDDTIGWINSSLYAWQKMKEEEQIVQEATYVDENGNSVSYKYIDTNEPIYSYTNFPAIVSNLDDPTLTYDTVGIWSQAHRIYFDYSLPVASGTAVNVRYYTDANIPQEIQDTWKQRMIDMLSKMREKIGGKLTIYNGFAVTRDYDNDFLQFADGGMFEGLFHNGWTPIYENISESYWKQQVDKLFDISHTKKKIFLAQTNALIDESTTEAEIQKLAMFSFASFLLGKGDYAYYGFNVFPSDGSIDQFIYFDYWETNIGEPLESYHLRETVGEVNIYEREFSNVLVLVNPSEIITTVNLGTSFRTLNGDIVNSVTLESKSGTILYKYGALSTTTTSIQPTTTTTSGQPTTTTTSIQPTTTTTSVQPATTTTSIQPTTTTSTSGGGSGGGGGGGGSVKTTSSTTSAAATSTTSIKVTTTSTSIKHEPGCLSVMPPAVDAGTTADVTVAVQNIDLTKRSGITLAFGCAGVTVNSVIATNANHISANVTIADDAPQSTGNITVADDKGTAEIICGNAFTVNAKPSVILTVNPGTVRSGFILPRIRTFTITGLNSNWDSTSIVKIQGIGILIPLSRSKNEIRMLALVPSKMRLPAGNHAVTVTTGNQICTGNLVIE